MANSSILLDNDEKTEIPAAVRLAQQQGFLSMEQQPVVPVAKLFFSFDIVNSTVYKANTVNWPIIIKCLNLQWQLGVLVEEEMSGSVKM